MFWCLLRQRWGLLASRQRKNIGDEQMTNRIWSCLRERQRWENQSTSDRLAKLPQKARQLQHCRCHHSETPLNYVRSTEREQLVNKKPLLFLSLSLFRADSTTATKYVLFFWSITKIGEEYGQSSGKCGSFNTWTTSYIESKIALPRITGLSCCSTRDKVKEGFVNAAKKEMFKKQEKRNSKKRWCFLSEFEQSKRGCLRKKSVLICNETWPWRDTLCWPTRNDIFFKIKCIMKEKIFLAYLSHIIDNKLVVE